MKVSVVIPAYNAAKTIEQCLESVLSQDFSDYEVTVVDDGSTDGTAKIVEKYLVRLIQKSNKGPSSARNVGFEASNSDSDIVIFLDSDCVVPSNWISEMIKPLQQNPEIGATQAFWDIVNRSSLIASLIFKVYEYIVRDLEYIDFCWTYSLAIRKELFLKVGKFDEMFKTASAEDVDLAYRIINRQYKILLLKKVRVFHPFPETISEHVKRQIKMARMTILLIRINKRFLNQRANLIEYTKLLLHGLTLLALFLVPLSPFLFLILLMLSLSFHLKLTYWAMRDNFKYILLIPFEFITKLCWVVGSIIGLWDLVQRFIGKRLLSKYEI